MARYYTTEELFECYSCHIRCARREMSLDCHFLKCPKCFKPLFGLQDYGTQEWAIVSHDPDILYPTPKFGIGLFRYIGNGEIRLPKITMQDVSSFSIGCAPCNYLKVVPTFDRYDANKRMGAVYKLPGVDIVEGGGTFVVPCTEEARVWLEDEEINLALYQVDRENTLWEYLLT